MDLTGNNLPNEGRTHQKLGVCDPEKRQPIDISSAGLVFRFEDGSGASIYTEDLIKLIKENCIESRVPKKDYKYALYGDAHPYFPENFFK